MKTSGGGPGLKLEGKIWRQGQQIRTLSSCTTKQNFGRIPILGSYLNFKGPNLGYF